MRLVDGGYLSWIFGTDGQRINSWSSARGKYLRSTGSLIAIDPDTNFRQQYYSLYKSKRRERSAEDPARAARAKRVKEFVKGIWLEDPSLATIMVPGYEADDLVSLSTILFKDQWPIEIVGADKDLLQLPQESLRLFHHDGSQVTLESYRKNLPKTLAPYFHTPKDLLLVLTLLGDDSDSVPRIVPTGNLALMAQIMRSRYPFTAAYEAFGPEVLRNLYLVALPGPWCFDPRPTPNEWLWIIERTEYPFDLPVKKDLVMEYARGIRLISSCNNNCK